MQPEIPSRSPSLTRLNILAKILSRINIEKPPAAFFSRLYISSPGIVLRVSPDILLRIAFEIFERAFLVF